MLCFLILHKWKAVDHIKTETFWDEGDTIPMYRTTKVLYVCTKCGKHKVKRFDGAFDNIE